MIEPDRCPQRVVLGKRPDFVRITPSKPNPWWQGNWEGEHRFTAEQWNAVLAAGGDPKTVEAIAVRREPGVHDPEFGGVVRVHQWKPVYEFECPIVGRLEDGSLRVLGPNGKPRTVRADGWAHNPSRNVYRG